MGRFCLVVTLLVGSLLPNSAKVDGQESAKNLSDREATTAPENCLFYTSWATPEMEAGNNHALLLMEEPEVVRFKKQLVKQGKKLIQLMMQEQPDVVAKSGFGVLSRMAESLFSKSGRMYIRDLNFNPENQSLQIMSAIVFDVGDDAKDLADAIAALAKVSGAELGKETINEVEFHKLAANGPMLSDVYLGASKGRVLLFTDKATVTEEMDRIESGKGKPAKWLVDLKGRMKISNQSSVSYVNLKALMDKFVPLGGQQAVEVVKELGLNQLATYEAAAGYDDEGMISKSLVRYSGKPRGILSVFNSASLDKGHLDAIPADALYAYSFNMSLENAMETFERVATKISPEMWSEFDRGMKSFQRELGFHPYEDLVAHLGSTWTIFNGQGDGWFGGLTLLVDLEDGDEINTTNQKIVRLLEQFSEDEYAGFELTYESFKGTNIYGVVALDFPMPLRPSWCVSDNKLIVGLFPQAVRTQLAPHPDDKKLSLDFVDIGTSKDGKLIGVGYSDTQQQFSMIYPYAQMMMAMAPTMLYEMGMPEEVENEVFDALSKISLPTPRSIHRHLRPMTTVTKSTDEGIESTTRQTIPSVNVAVAAPVAVALLLPAVQAAREAARRTQSMNNLKQIALACHNFHDVFKGFPAGYSVDDEGKPLLSWRVHILPFIEQNALYDQFHLDEPWDSEHNIKLLDKMPQVYRAPNSVAGENKTVYRGFGGEGAIMKGSTRAKRTRGTTFGQIRDGSSNTVMFMEVSDELAIEWTKPEVLDFSETKPSLLFGNSPGGTNAALADGSVQFLSNLIDEKALEWMINMSDGRGFYDGSDRFDKLPRALESKEAIEIEEEAIDRK